MLSNMMKKFNIGFENPNFEFLALPVQIRIKNCEVVFITHQLILLVFIIGKHPLLALTLGPLNHSN